MIDKVAEAAKISKKLGEVEKLIDATSKKLGNEAFVSKAPAHIVGGLRDQLIKLQLEYAALKKNLEELR